ncbi:MAG: hypothetical protein IKL55_01510 [Clostridia bacterium]|nr:hypothetical protein [Clostridia bacterium]
MKNKIITISFIICLFGIFFTNLIVKDTDISISERRKLAKFPEINSEDLINGKWTEEFEDYTQDQFVGRDLLKNVKSFWSINIFRQKDNNKMFEKDGALYKMEYPLSETNVRKNAEKIKNVYDKYLTGKKVYFSIIPEKNYYLNDEHLLMDYNKIEDIMKDNLYNSNKFEYISILNELKLEDYYKTDIHWRQENILKVADKISTSMGQDIVSDIDYAKENVGKFYGTYYGQIASKVEPDDMYILTNDTIKNSITYNFETQKEGEVYDRKETNDKYDIYLSGATPLIKMTNINAKTDKELLLFRDSFGSSFAPLLVENYKTITLIDLRYISSEILDRFIEFENQDVLFLYSSLILNQNVLK